MGKRLGQHFLHHRHILERIVKESEIKPEDLVVEIGPGKGRLTEILSRIAHQVIAIEVDEDLCNALKEKFQNFENVRIVCQDVLKFNLRKLPPFKVVSNIPYYITTPIIFLLIDPETPCMEATLTVQKEVAERIVASPGTKQYGMLSLMVQAVSEPEILFFIPKGAFTPPPKVDSAVLRIKKLKVPRVPPDEFPHFKKIVKTAFSKRRKTLYNALKSLGIDKVFLERINIDPKRRPETLSLEEYLLITRSLNQIPHRVGPSPRDSQVSRA